MDGAENQPAQTTNPTPEGTTPSGAGNSNEQAPTSTPTNGGSGTGADADGGTYGFTPEQLKEMKTFYENNGGFEAVKSKLSNPPKPVEQPIQPQQPIEQQQPQAQQFMQPNEPEPAKIPDGYYSPKEMLLQDYMEKLANSDKYAPIRDYMQEDNGKTLAKDLISWGKNPMDAQGNINVAGIHEWLDLKLQTVPPKQTQVEPTTTPTVDYVEVGDKITSKADVEKIIAQNVQLRAAGLKEHPLTAEAKKFMSELLKNSR